MKLLSFETAEVENRIESAAQDLRLQHKLFSLNLDSGQTRAAALRLLSHSLRIIARLEGYRNEIVKTHAERILCIAMGPKKIQVKNSP